MSPPTYVPEESATRRPPSVQLTVARVVRVGGLAQANSPVPTSMFHSTPMPLNASIALPCWPETVSIRLDTNMSTQAAYCPSGEELFVPQTPDPSLCLNFRDHNTSRSEIGPRKHVDGPIWLNSRDAESGGARHGMHAHRGGRAGSNCAISLGVVADPDSGRLQPAQRASGHVRHLRLHMGCY